MRNALLFLFVVVLSMNLFAQSFSEDTSLPTDEDSVSLQDVDSLPEVTPRLTDHMPNVRLVQDQAISQLVEDKILGRQQGIVETSGFRLQVYSSNAPAVAKKEALQIQEYVQPKIDQPLYVISAPPFIKVRIGDFQTVEQAQEYKNEFIKLFPDLVGEAYVVRDEHIQLRVHNSQPSSKEKVNN